MRVGKELPDDLWSIELYNKNGKLLHCMDDDGSGRAFVEYTRPLVMAICRELAAHGLGGAAIEIYPD